jgi:hypothetical protein
VIDAEFDMKDHGSIPRKYDREGENWPPNQIKLVVKVKKEEEKKKYAICWSIKIYFFETANVNEPIIIFLIWWIIIFYIKVFNAL